MKATEGMVLLELVWHLRMHYSFPVTLACLEGMQLLPLHPSAFSATGVNGKMCLSVCVYENLQFVRLFLHESTDYLNSCMHIGC